MSRIHNNAGGIIIENRSVLMVRAAGKDYYVSPGGGVEEGETHEAALCRELMEELRVTVNPENLALFGIYKADAKGRPGEKIIMKAYMVNGYEGTLLPSSEIEELAWFNTENPEPNSEHSIFKNEILPKLAQQDLID
jgi:8-oxo-dGTP diphosphatase